MLKIVRPKGQFYVCDNLETINVLKLYMPVDSQSAFEFMAMAESIQCDLRKAYASVFKLLSSDI